MLMISLILWGVCYVGQAQLYYSYLVQKNIAWAEEVESFSEPFFIKDIEVTEQKKESLVTIKASKPLTYTVVKLKEPLRIVVDIPEFTTERTMDPLVVDSEVINKIINKQMEKGERKFLRIEIGLNKDVGYEVTTELSDLMIRVAKPGEIVEKDKKAVETKTKRADITPHIVEGENIVDLEISKDLDGMTVVTDKTIRNYNAFLLENPYRLVVDIPGVEYHLAKHIFSFQSPFIQKIKVGQHPEKVRFAVYFRDRLPTYKIEKKNNKLLVVWGIPPMAEKEEKGKEVAAEVVPVKEEREEEVVKEAERLVETVQEVVLAEKEEKGKAVAAEVVPVKEEREEEVVRERDKETGAPQEAIPPEGEKPGGEKVYTGQKISLDFKDADIRNILRLISDISGLNIIVSDNVKGQVTIKLENVPWDEVLDIILETNNLGKIWMKSVMRIETQEEIRKLSEEKYRAQKSREKVEEMMNEVVDIIYRDATDILDLLVKEKELTSERGAISVDPNLNRLIITDTPDKIVKIKEKIRRYDDRTVRQVFIEAKIIQSIPTHTKEIGIQWGGPYSTTGNDGKTIYGVAGETGVTFEKEEVTDPITGLTSELVNVVGGDAINLPAAVGLGAGGGIGFGILRDNLELTATLTAMEKDEKLKIISSPRVLSIDKNEAMIKQGVALPYLKLSEEGVTSTEFKDAVLELKVTPTILSEKIIKVELKVKKDQKSAQTGAGGEPGIDVREAQTILMVESGRTVVIGGIYEEGTTTIRSGVPFFSDIPGVGRIFRNDFKKKELTELLIFITTTIVPKEIIGAGL